MPMPQWFDGGGFGQFGPGAWGGRPPIQGQGQAPPAPTGPNFAPQPWQAFGQVPYITPYQITPDQYAQFVPQLFNAMQTSLQPFFNQQQTSLDQNYAGRGLLQSGTAAQGYNDLLNQQFATLLQGTIPAAQQAVGANVGAENVANAANAGMYSNVVGQNMGQYNQYLNQLMQGYLGSYGGPNAGAIGILGQGAAGAGSAYGNAYGNAMSGYGSLPGAFSNLFGSFGSRGGASNPAGGDTSPTGTPGGEDAGYGYPGY